MAKDGSVDTGFSTQFGRIEAGRRYNEVLAAAIGGEIKEYADKTGAVKTRNGKTPRLSDFLPQHDQLWLDAMSRYISDICGQQEGQTTGAVAGENQSPSEEQLRKLAHERVPNFSALNLFPDRHLPCELDQSCGDPYLVSLCLIGVIITCTPARSAKLPEISDTPPVDAAVRRRMRELL